MTFNPQPKPVKAEKPNRTFVKLNKKELPEKTCKVCGTVFLPKNSFQKCIVIECVIAQAKEKELIREGKRQNKERKEGRESLMTHSDWLQLFQKVFNTFIRTRDKDLPCISCNTQKNVKYDCGHFYPTTYSYLRFNEDNCHKQCSSDCNVHKSGNIHEYRVNLIKKIGIERVEKLDADKHLSLKLTIAEIKDLIILYRKKTKELK